MAELGLTFDLGSEQQSGWGMKTGLGLGQAARHGFGLLTEQEFGLQWGRGPGPQ